MKNANTLLLIDDQVDYLNLLAEHLEMQGFQVLKAQNGASAKDCILNNPEIQFVIADLHLPDINGIEIADWEYNRDNSRKIPFILSTGFLNDQDSKKASELKIIEFLPKPFDIELLSETLHRILRYV